MVKVIIDVPDEIEKKAKMLKLELSLLAIKAFRDKINQMEKIERFKESVSKSKLTEEDVEELSDKINAAMWEYHKKKYNL